jgi:dTDP-4-dehydrorhamnose 3,5-epimerase
MLNQSGMKMLSLQNDNLPAGVLVQRLSSNMDARGSVLEIFRAYWATGCEPVQWTAFHSNPRVLRGVHVHAIHTDYLTLISGKMLLGLHDLREDQGHIGPVTSMITLDATQPIAITIPPGVCHGFFFPVSSLAVIGVNRYWNPQDDIGCRYDAAELNLDWPECSPILSERDKMASTYEQMKATYREISNKIGL